MASALTVLLLGCWLAGHSGVWGEPSYPKPNISLLSPSWGVSLGGAVTVQCCSQHEGLQFVLNKEGRRVQIVNSDFLALFLINNVSREDGGSYNCSYHNQSEPSAMSDPSDPMELVVRDPGLPRPSISLSPTGVTVPGADVTIRCQGQRRDVRFFLHKAGDRNPQQHMGPAENVAEFHIPSMGRQHGGNYSCSYRLRSEPFVSSLPSNTVDIFAAGRLDFTYTNIARLVLSAVVLLVLGLILAEACYSRPRGGALGAWIPPSREENLLRGQAASPRGAETPAQPPLLRNTPAPENPPQQLPI
ncbi:immunoglobulin superfamily member 1-like [Mauremys reevesii]|uniref:immunoglobulin superfamily member 1-like n=1 Tax=Mauremys reevesii TaxID=260615 RepID=UPI00193F7164|nr:immunoglobulin superfamily member 1-like [Mauremys reevesii]